MTIKIGVTCGDYVRRGIGRYNQELDRYIDGDDRFAKLRSRPSLEELTDLGAVHFTSQFHLPEISIPYLVTVHDVIPVLFFEEFERKAQLKYPEHAFRDRVASDLARIIAAAHVIVPSECTKRDLVKVTGMPEKDITVVPMGIDGRFFAADAYRPKLSPSPGSVSILYVGALDDRKNLALALEVLLLLISYGYVPHLVVAGHFCSEGRIIFEQIVIQKGLADHVTLISDASDFELLCAFHAVDVFLFPSLYEGFGMPPVEAMLCGTPVVSSSASCMPEVLGQANALYFDPTDPGHAAQLVLETVQDVEATRRRIDRAVRHASQYTWRRAVDETLLLYKKFLGLTGECVYDHAA